jgi:4-amino-4-deoxy-L-arabinose transferase-like glycosyltransferase
MTKRWSILRNIHLIPGTILFAVIVAPWYLQMDALHPGYLKYYFWDEHFGRFASDSFNRSQPWYYFILVGLVGFFPWTMALPWVVSQFAKRRPDDKTRFLMIWTLLPFLFFSASSSKLPHYILPIFPALAILTATALVRLHRVSPSRLSFALSLTVVGHALTALYLVIGIFWPAILPRAIRASIQDIALFLSVYGGLLVALIALLIYRQVRRPWPSQRQFYLVHGFGICIFLIFVVRVMLLAAPDRSAKALAVIAASQITDSTQVMFYDTYLSGLPFYLRTERPIWMVTHSDKKRTFLGNFYARTDRDEPITHWGKALLDFEEFQEKWDTTKGPVLIVVKEKNQGRLEEQIGASAPMLAAVDDYRLLLKP